LITSVLGGKVGADKIFDADWGIYAQYDVNHQRKISIARRIAALPDDDVSIELANFREVILQVLQYLDLTVEGDLT